MKRWSVIKLLFPWVIILAVTSCGTTTDYAGGGIGGTGISVGKITAFGSVWVNGVEYSTTGAVIAVDGSESVSDGSLDYDRSLLDEGRIVAVHWEKDANGNPVAKRIEFKDNLEGAVTDIDTANQTIDVLGQTVKVDGATVFEVADDNKIVGDINAILSAISLGNIIEVSGFVVDVNGTIHATYLELKSLDFTPGDTEVEIKGVITNLDTPSGTFTIGNLTVDYNSATELPSSGLSNDMYVEVKGTLDESGLALRATKIEIEDDIFENVGGKRVEIEGIVTAIVDVNGQFEVNRKAVRIITGTTLFEDGATEADIILGAEIEVEGAVDEDGVLVAEKIDIESGDHGSDGSGDDSTDDSDNETGENAP